MANPRFSPKVHSFIIRWRHHLRFSSALFPRRWICSRLQTDGREPGAISLFCNPFEFYTCDIVIRVGSFSFFRNRIHFACTDTYPHSRKRSWFLRVYAKIRHILSTVDYGEEQYKFSTFIFLDILPHMCTLFGFHSASFSVPHESAKI